LVDKLAILRTRKGMATGDYCGNKPRRTKENH
jgi:hypothetical protein